MDPETESRRWITVAGFVIAAIAIVGVPIVASRFVEPSGTTHSFVIPTGTADRIAAGEEVTIIPADLRMRLRDRLVVVNDDTVTHQVASIVVGPGERVETRFSEAVSLSGFCSLHPSGQITSLPWRRCGS